MQTAKAIIVGGGKLKATADLELAKSPAEKVRGLSGRSTVPAGTGMLFDSVGAYWMKNVSVPLDIAFTRADGTILEVQTMPVPTSESDLPLYRPKSAGAKQTVEFPMGWLRKQGVVPGDRIIVLGD